MELAGPFVVLTEIRRDRPQMFSLLTNKNLRDRVLVWVIVLDLYFFLISLSSGRSAPVVMMAATV